jgi:DNA recombination protein RmuC
MAILNTVRAVLKDANMREQAGYIQAEVMKLLEDVERIDKRVGNLARHFGNVQDDIKEIQTSAKKVSTRGNRIEEMQLGEETSDELSEPDLSPPQLVPLPRGNE